MKTPFEHSENKRRLEPDHADRLPSSGITFALAASYGRPAGGCTSIRRCEPQGGDSGGSGPLGGCWGGVHPGGGAPTPGLRRRTSTAPTTAATTRTRRMSQIHTWRPRKTVVKRLSAGYR